MAPFGCPTKDCYALSWFTHSPPQAMYPAYIPMRVASSLASVLLALCSSARFGGAGVGGKRGILTKQEYEARSSAEGLCVSLRVFRL
jgi:hypothetical protein